jgi:outer membrane receptor for ferrienterochelin and colicins
MKKLFFFFILIYLPLLALSQEKKTDSIPVTQLQEVVVTGQFEPQSIKKSVFNVRLITAKDIQNLAANNLSDVLSQYLNITVTPNGTSGRSTVSLFGLDAQYFKILIDAVPVINEAGFGNNTDLSQINLNDIEQIEIVEGSMGVTHGANAVSGVLNIITKKTSRDKWNISTFVQEETIKNEYSLFQRGRHIQALKISHSINNKWFVNLGVNRNDFQGFLNDRKGKDYKENDQTRGYRWLPKEQINTTALLSYREKDLNVFYKFEYLDETIDFYNSTVHSGYNTNLGSYRYASDKRYVVNRYFQNLNSTGKIFSKLAYNVSFSHQKQTRNIEDFKYYLQTKTEANNTITEDQSMEVFYSTGTLSNFFSNKKIDIQLGYEIVNNKGFSLIQEANNVIVPIRKTLENYDFFISSEIKTTEKLSIRPGLRISAQSKFKDQYASSLVLRYLFNKGIELRGAYGNSFRTPSFEELYSKQIFDGHFFSGNKNLIPETSISYEMSLKKTSFSASNLQILNTISGSFLTVNNRIDMALVRFDTETGNPQYEYININKYKMCNLSVMKQLKKDNWSFTIGASIIGISQEIKKQSLRLDETYLYSFNLNSSATYMIPKWNTTFSTYFKYNGKSQQFVEDSSTYTKSNIDSSSWLDTTIRKTFFKDKVETTIGAKNLLNITNINQTKTNENTGHPTSSQIMLAYGRSYFFKITYNLIF